MLELMRRIAIAAVLIAMAIGTTLVVLLQVLMGVPSLVELAAEAARARIILLGLSLAGIGLGTVVLIPLSRKVALAIVPIGMVVLTGHAVLVQWLLGVYSLPELADEEVRLRIVALGVWLVGLAAGAAAMRVLRRREAGAVTADRR
jgi:hypothetical protein